MAIESSGPISLGTTAGADRSISAEFGGDAPHALSEYYDKGNAPSSGEIQLAADFYGTSAANTDRPGDGAYDSDAYTVLLIHSDTSDGSTTFDDSGVTDHTITANSNCAHSTSQAKIGASSISFPDSESNYLSMADHSDWTIQNNWTIEAWVRYDVLPHLNTNNIEQIVSQHEDTSNYWWAALHEGADSNKDKLRIYAEDGGSGVFNISSDDVDLSVDTWYHVAFVRDGDTARFFLDGVAKGTGSLTENMPSLAGSMFIGSSNDWGGVGSNMRGYIDELRISNIARWTSNFTVY